MLRSLLLPELSPPATFSRSGQRYSGVSRQRWGHPRAGSESSGAQGAAYRKRPSGPPTVLFFFLPKGALGPQRLPGSRPWWTVGVAQPAASSPQAPSRPALDPCNLARPTTLLQLGPWLTLPAAILRRRGRYDY